MNSILNLVLVNFRKYLVKKAKMRATHIQLASNAINTTQTNQSNKKNNTNLMVIFVCLLFVWIRIVDVVYHVVNGLVGFYVQFSYLAAVIFFSFPD